MLCGISHEENFKNMLRLMRFGIYFERILKIKELFSYGNNYSIVAHIMLKELGRHMILEKFLKSLQYGAFWCIF